MADQALPCLVRPVQHGILLDFVALGAKVTTRRNERDGGLVIGGSRLVTVLTPQSHRCMDKFTLVFGGVAFQAGFGL
jgi:hypothetical protein